MGRQKTKKSLFAIAVATAALVASLSAGPVLAGEEHAQGASWCRYSGLNDEPDAPAPEGGRVQSYGQLVRQGLKAENPSPGVACNPTRTFLPPLR